MLSHDELLCAVPSFPTTKHPQISCRTVLSFDKGLNLFELSSSVCLLPVLVLSFLLSLSEDKVWTTVYHDLQMQTSVGGSSPEKLSVLQLNYSATMDQISAITSSAEYCEQFISYSCKMSRLLNTPGRLRKAISIKYGVEGL